MTILKKRETTNHTNKTNKKTKKGKGNRAAKKTIALFLFLFVLLFFMRVIRVMRGLNVLSSHRDAHQFFDLLGHVVPAEALLQFRVALLAKGGAEIGVKQNAFDAPDEALLGG